MKVSKQLKKREKNSVRTHLYKLTRNDAKEEKKVPSNTGDHADSWLLQTHWSSFTTITCSPYAATSQATVQTQTSADWPNFSRPALPQSHTQWGFCDLILSSNGSTGKLHRASCEEAASPVQEAYTFMGLHKVWLRYLEHLLPSH